MLPPLVQSSSSQPLEFSFDERQHNFLPGFTTEDLGSTSDAWEWDDEYYLEDDLAVTQPSDHGAWLPEYSKELDLELELDNEVKELTLTRLPPSGCSSVESI